MILHTRSLVALVIKRTLAFAAVLILVGCAVLAAIAYRDFRIALVSAIVGGPFWMIGMRIVKDWRSGVLSARLPVAGRDAAIPRAVLRARVPSGPATPTRWRNEKGHRRYGIEG